MPNARARQAAGRGAQKPAAKTTSVKSAAPARPAAKKATPAKAAKATEPKVRKSDPKDCHCGCGAKTKGGLFVIGHDAKLKSALCKAFVAGDATMKLGNSPYNGQAPMDIAKQRGWESYLTKAKAMDVEKASRPARSSAGTKAKGKVEVDAEVTFNYRGGKRRGTVTEVAGERARVEFEFDGKTETRAFDHGSLTVVKAAA